MACADEVQPVEPHQEVNQQLEFFGGGEVGGAFGDELSEEVVEEGLFHFGSVLSDFYQIFSEDQDYCFGAAVAYL